MADLNIVLMFCVLYSGVVLSTLWMTVAQGAARRATQESPHTIQARSFSKERAS